MPRRAERRRRASRRIRAANGQSSVEVVLLLPFVLALLGVVVQAGILASHQVAVAAEAAEAVRIAARTGDRGRIAAVTAPHDRVEVDEPDGRQAEAIVRVRVTRRVAPGVPLVRNLWPAEVAVIATSAAAIETP